MMIPYMDLSQARAQLEELDSRGTEHGNHFNFDKLTNAYKEYIDKYSSCNYSQCSELWCKGVGGSQKDLPIHVLQDYWRADVEMGVEAHFKIKMIPVLCPSTVQLLELSTCLA